MAQRHQWNTLVSTLILLFSMLVSCQESSAPLQASTLSTVALSLDPGNTVLYNWNESYPCSSWTGVSCDSSYNVINISLTYLGLDGTIPSALGSISTLVYLDLSSNWLNGSLPDSLGSLSSLEVLRLKSNLLEGPIPSSLGNLTALKELGLFSNMLTGSIPSSFTNLINLQILDLGFNNLNGTLADDFFSQMTAITEISLAFNQFNGSLPSSLGTLKNMTSLNLAGNQFHGALLDSLARLPGLSLLNFSSNYFSGEIPSEFFSSSSPFTILDLGVNFLEGTIPAINSTKLDQLHLEDNSLKGYVTDMFPSPPQTLTLIHLSTNSFQGPIPSTLFNLSNLATLRLDNNLLSGNLPSNTTGAKSLSILHLYDNLLSGPFPPAFTAFPSLQQLIISSNSISGDLSNYNFSGLLKCVKLSMARNLFTGGLPESFPPNVLTIDLTGNLLSGAINGSLFADLRNLTAVLLGQNRFTGGIPYELWNSTSLEYVTLDHNSLTEVPTVNVSSLVWDGTGYVLAGGNPICDNATIFPGSSLPSSVCGVPSSMELDWTPSEATPGFPVSCTDTVCPGRQFISPYAYNVSGGQTCACSLPLNVTILLYLCPFTVYNETVDALSLKLRRVVAAVVPLDPPLSIQQVWVISATQSNSLGAQLLVLQFYPNSTAEHAQFSGSAAAKIITFFQTTRTALGAKWGPLTFVSSVLTTFEEESTTASSGSGISWWTILLGAVFSVVFLAACAIIVWFFCIREKDRYKSRFDREIEQFFVRHIPLSEVKEMTQNFSEDNILGEGGFGMVFRGTTAGNQPVAVKRAKESSKAGALQEFQKEVRAISQMSHNNVVKLLSYCDDEGEQILVYEFCQHGTLKQQLHPKDGRNTLSFQKRLEIAIGAAEGLRYMHIFANPPVIHRDIKSDNILIDGKWQAKISDFGLLKNLPAEGGESNEGNMEIAGTRGYLDPEYFVTGRVTPKSDVFSFGVVLLELITGRLPVMKDRNSDETNLLYSWATPYIQLKKYDKIVDASLEGNYPQDAMIELQKIAGDCVERLSTHRPEMSEVAIRLGTIHGVSFFAAREAAKADSGRRGFSSMQSFHSATSATELLAERSGTSTVISMEHEFSLVESGR